MFLRTARILAILKQIARILAILECSWTGSAPGVLRKMSGSDQGVLWECFGNALGVLWECSRSVRECAGVEGARFGGPLVAARLHLDPRGS